MAEQAISGTGPIRIEVAYALPDQQWVLDVRLPAGSTARQAIEASGILARFPAIDLTRDPVGIFGKIVPLTQALREGDRVEIYRPLAVDPKLARRHRAGQTRRKRN